MEKVENISKRERLYDNLLKTGKVTQQQIGTRDQFLRALNNRDKASTFYNRISPLFSPREIGNELEFLSFLDDDYKTKEEKDPFSAQNILSRQAEQPSFAQKQIQEAINRPQPGTLPADKENNLPQQMPLQMPSQAVPPQVQGFDIKTSADAETAIKQLTDENKDLLEPYKAVRDKIEGDYRATAALGKEGKTMNIASFLTKAKIPAKERQFYEQNKVAAEQVEDRIKALYLQRDLLRLSENLKKYDDTKTGLNEFLQGLTKTGLLKDFVSMGVTEIDRNLKIAGIAQKAQNNPESLSKEEKDVLDIYKQFKDIEGGKKSFWYTAGQSSQKMVPFILSIAGANIAASGLRTGMKEAFSIATKEMLQGATKRTIAANLGKKIGESALFNLMSLPTRPMLYTEFSENAIDPKRSIGSNIYESSMRTFWEYFAEEFSVVTGNFGTSMLENRVLRKTLGKYADNLSKIANNKYALAAKNILDKTQIGNVPVEIGEEVLTNLGNALTLLSKQDLQELADPDFYKSIAVSTLFFQGAMLGAQTTAGGIGNRIERNNINTIAKKSLNNLQTLSSSINDPGVTPVLQSLINNINQGNIVDENKDVYGSPVLADMSSLSDVINKSEITPENKDNILMAASKAVADNAKKKGVYTGIEALAEKEMGGQFSNTKDASNVYILTDREDKQFYLIDHQDENAGAGIEVVRPVEGGEKIARPSIDFVNISTIPKQEFIEGWLAAREQMQPIIAEQEAQQAAEEELDAQSQQELTIEELSPGMPVLFGGEKVIVDRASEAGIQVIDAEGGMHYVDDASLLQRIPKLPDIVSETAVLQQEPTGPAIMPETEQQAENIPPAEQQEQQIPLTKDGQPDYDAMNPEMLYSELSKAFSEGEAKDILVSTIEDLKTQKKKLEGKKTTSITERVKNRSELKVINDRIAGLEELFKPKQVAQTIINKPKKKANRTNTNTPFQKEIMALGEPASPYEAIAFEIAWGTKIKMNDSPGAKGFAKHLGLKSNKEIGSYIGIRNEKEGMTPEAFAHYIWETDQTGLFANMDTMQILDVILDVLHYTNSKRRALEYIKEIREHGIEKEKEFYESAPRELTENELNEIINNYYEEFYLSLSEEDNRAIDNIFIGAAIDENIYNTEDLPEDDTRRNIESESDREGSNRNIPEGPAISLEGGDNNQAASEGSRDQRAESIPVQQGNDLVLQEQLKPLTPQSVEIERLQKEKENAIAEKNRLIKNNIQRSGLFGDTKVSPEDLFAGEGFDPTITNTLVKRQEDLIVEIDRKIDALKKNEQAGLKEAENQLKIEEIRAEEAKVDINPSEAQKEAGNYQKGHVTIQGLDVTIENPKGSVRSGVDKTGKKWSITLNNSYGYALGTTSKDGDHVDIFLGDNPLSEKVFVIDQINKDKSFDEHKVMIGFDSIEQARDAYLSNYEEGWQGLGNITETTMEQFTEWAKSGSRRIKPFTEYKQIQAEQTPQSKEAWQMTKDEFDEITSNEDVFAWNESEEGEKSNKLHKEIDELIKKEKKAPGKEKDIILKRIQNINSEIAAIENKWINEHSHIKLIQQALSEGKPVPKEVLNDYPELKAEISEKPDARTASKEDWLKWIKSVPRSQVIFPDFLRSLTSEWDKDGKKDYISYYFDDIPIVTYHATSEPNQAPLRQWYYDWLENKEVYPELQKLTSHEEIIRDTDSIDTDALAEVDEELDEDNKDEAKKLLQQAKEKEVEQKKVPVKIDDHTTVMMSPEKAKGWKEKQQAVTNYALSQIFTLNSLRQFEKDFRDGMINVDTFKEAFKIFQNSQNELELELRAKTKAELLEDYNSYFVARYKNESKDFIIKRILQDNYMTFALSTISYSMDERLEDAVEKKVGKITQKDIDDKVEEIAKNREEYKQKIEAYKKSLTNPETLEEFKVFIRKNGMSALTVEQKAIYDELVTDEVIGKRNADTEKKSEISKVDIGSALMNIVEAKHTKTGEPLFVVQLSERVENQVYNDLNKKARVLDGYYSSYRGNGAVPGFIFKEKEQATKFVSLQDNDIQNKDTVEQKTEEKKQSIANKLRESANNIIQAANEELSRERLTNTYKRANMANNADAKAAESKRIGNTMLNIANAIENGDVKLLDGIKAKTHIDLLDGLVKSANSLELSAKYPSDYSEQQKHKSDPVDINTIEYLKSGFYPSIYASHINNLLNKVEGIRGLKLITSRWRKRVANLGEYDSYNVRSDDEINELIELTNGLDSFDKKYNRIIDQIKDHKRLRAMGIENDSMLRAALREYVQYRGGKQEENRVKKLERDIVGKNVGFDFFPTPKSVAEIMVSEANISKGMDILEPSAGNGNIAEVIKATGVTPDVIEISSQLREILEAKNFPIVGTDFMEYSDKKYDRIIMNPPFSDGADGEHVSHAYKLLKPGGRIVAIVGEGIFIRGDRKAVAFRQWLESVNGSEEKLPEKTFTDKNLLKTTQAKARLVIIDKPTESQNNKIDEETVNAILYREADMPETITINGTERPTRNSDGNFIHPTEDGVINFYKWFKDSKIVDTEGRPLVVYHGTGSEFTVFGKDKGNSHGSYLKNRQGFFFANRNEAELYGNGILVPAYLSLQNPNIINVEHALSQLDYDYVNEREEAEAAGYPISRWIGNGNESFEANDSATAYLDDNINEIIEEADALENDGVLVQGVDGSQTIIAFSPNQIKSATDNTGEFSSDNADIRYRDKYFYSPTEQALNRIRQEKGTQEQWKAMLLKNGAKEAEMDWMQWDEFVKDKKTITKADIQNWINHNRIEVQEEVKEAEPFPITADDVKSVEQNEDGEWVVTFKEEAYGVSVQPDATTAVEAINNAIQEIRNSDMFDFTYEQYRTKYHKYQEPGGENYKELLMMMPNIPGGKIWKVKAGDNSAQVWNKEFNNEPDYLNYIEGLKKDEIPFKTTVKGKETPAFKSPHWYEPNILAHIRFNERILPAKGANKFNIDYDNWVRNGKKGEKPDDKQYGKDEKVLFLEEIQSDWAQKGKKEGFRRNLNQIAKDLEKHNIKPIESDGILYFEDNNGYVVNRTGNSIIIGKKAVLATEEELDLITEYSENYSDKLSIPDMPFKNTDQWVNLALRRMMIYAADNGFDRIAWTTGDMQGERYDLSKQINKVKATNEKGSKKSYSWSLWVTDVENNVHHFIPVDDNNLSEIVGKELAEKIITDNPNRWDEKEYFGLDLKVGGEGMKAFYDNIIPAQANKIGKKFGAKVEYIDIQEMADIPSIPITDAIREQAAIGMPLYHSFNSDIESVNNKFNEEIDEQTNGSLEKGHIYHLGTPDAILLSAGIPNLPIEMAASRLTNKSNQENHPFELSEIKNLPQALQSPLAVFRSATHIGSNVILTELRQGEKNFVVAIETNSKRGKIIVNSIRSIHPRTTSNIIRWIAEDLMDYANKEKLSEWVQEKIKSRSYLNSSNPADVKQQLDFATKIIKDFENPTLKQGNFISTAEILSVELDTAIKVIKDSKQIPASQVKKRRAKGWYDPKTDTISVVIPNHSTIGDLQATILHEAVAHKGLRGLLGDRFIPTMREVFASMPDEMKADHFAKYGDKVTAAEEYLASIAEKDIPPTLLQKIFAVIRDAFRALGIDFRLNNSDIAYLLWRSKNRLKSPNTATVKEVVNDIGRAAEKKEELLYRQQEYTPDTNDIKLSALDAAITKIQDRMIAVKRLTDEVKRRGGNVSFFKNPYEMEILSTSKSKAAMDIFAEEYMKPITDIVKDWTKRGIDDKDRWYYMIAKHAPERNKVITSGEVYEYITGRMKSEEEREYLSDRANLSKIRNIINNAYDSIFYDESLSDFDVIGKEFILLNGIQINAVARFKNIKGSEAGNMRSGMTDEEAGKIVTKFEKDLSAAEIGKFWAAVRKATQFALEQSFTHQLISSDIYNDIKDLYRYYVPLRGWEVKENVDYTGILGDNYMGGAIISSVNKHAFGRESIAEDPLAHIPSMAESSVVWGNKNEVRLAAWRLAEANREMMTDLFLIKDSWLINIAAPGEEAIWETTFEPPAQHLIDAGLAVKAKTNNTYKWHKTREQLKAHEVPVYVNGEYVLIDFKGNIGVSVAKAINGSGVTGMDKFHSGVSAITRTMAALSTSKNPDFMLTNFLRDAQFGFKAYFIRGGNPFALAANIPIAWRAINNEYFGRNKDGEVEKLYRKFIEYGGETGWVHINNVEQHKKRLNNMIKEANQAQSVSPQLAAKKVYRAVNGTLEYLAQMSENAMRFAAFKTEIEHELRQSGLQEPNEEMYNKAAISAKELTTNFNRKGEWSKYAGAYWAFFNASIQGNANMIRLAKENPGRFILTQLSALAFRMLGPALIFAFGGDDDKDNYDNLSQYVKDSYAVFPSPFEKGIFITIPLPHGHRATTSIGNIVFDNIRGKREGDIISEYMKNLISEVSPWNIVGLDKSTLIPETLAEAVLTIIPTWAKPITEASYNLDFLGNTIEREHLLASDDEIKPRFTKAKSTTNKIFIGAAKELNKLFGGRDDISARLYYDEETKQVKESTIRGWFDMSPALIEHIFEGYLGGVGRFINDTYKTTNSLIKGEVPKKQNIPVVRRLYQEPYDDTAWRSYYDTKKRVLHIKTYMLSFSKAKDIKGYTDINTLYNNKIITTFDAYDKIIHDLRKQYDLLPDNSPMKQAIDKEIDNKAVALRDAIKEIDKLYNKR